MSFRSDIQFLFLALIALMQGCTISEPAEQMLNCANFIVCDTCRNDELSIDNISSIRMLNKWYIVYQYSKNPTSEIYAGMCVFNDGLRGYEYYGNFIYDSSVDSVQYIPGDHCIEWSPDGINLLTMEGFNNIVVCDILSKTTKYFTFTTPSRPTWSLDGKYVFFQNFQDLWRMDNDGSNAHVIANGIKSPRQVSDSTIIGFSSDLVNDGTSTDILVIYNMKTDVMQKSRIDFPPSGLRIDQTDNAIALSPDRRFALISAYPDQRSYNVKNSPAGLFLINIPSGTYERLLPVQQIDVAYQPKWITNTSFAATYYCYKDSSAMIYEFDINGKLMKQLTYREMKFYR